MIIKVVYIEALNNGKSFALSNKAVDMLIARGKGYQLEGRVWAGPRDDMDLVEVVEELGDAAGYKDIKFGVRQMPENTTVFYWYWDEDTKREVVLTREEFEKFDGFWD